MSKNMKTGPLKVEEDMEVSSDDRNQIVENQNNDPDPKPGRSTSPGSQCSICLGKMENSSCTETCSHMFCFECLKTWAIINSSCPLCKTFFTTILHTFDAQGSHESFSLPLRSPSGYRVQVRDFHQLFSFGDEEVDEEVDEESVILNINLFVNLISRTQVARISDTHKNNDVIEQLRGHLVAFNNLPGGYAYSTRPVNINLNEPIERYNVYRYHFWAEPFPDSTDNCTLDYYRANPSALKKLEAFFTREVAAIRSIPDLEDVMRRPVPWMNTYEISNVMFLGLKSIDMHGPDYVTKVEAFLGKYASHFAYELHNFARSPVDLNEYNKRVRYSFILTHTLAPQIISTIIGDDTLFGIPLNAFKIPINPNNPVIIDSDSDEIIICSSDDDEPPKDKIIVSSSECEDEMIPNDDDDTSFRDQPSTSTGITKSSNRPNTRYNLKNRK